MNLDVIASGILGTGALCWLSRTGWDPSGAMQRTPHDWLHIINGLLFNGVRKPISM